MNLSMAGELAAAYHSGAQRARVVTEAWGEKNLFCPNCCSPKLTWLEPGHPASDYSCPQCNFWYQLKSQKTRLGDNITDGAYDAMMDAIRRDELPSMYFMQYEVSGRDAAPRRPRTAGASRPYQQNQSSRRDDPTNEIIWTVRNLLLVPHFAFPPSAIIKRKPLAPTARRAGWVGCNFALNRIPIEARIGVVTTIGRARSPSEPRRDRDIAPYQQTIIISPEEVREKFKRVKPLKEIGVKQRGWTLDVLNIVRRICDRSSEREFAHSKGRSRLTSAATFTTSDVYTFTRELEKLHPDNRHVHDKIRQQLQVLRDAGLLIHVGRGVWRLP